MNTRKTSALSEPMIALLKRLGGGHKVSYYRVKHTVGAPSQPFWSNIGVEHPAPSYMVCEALKARGLLEPYDDAAGITDAGRAALLEIHEKERNE